MQLCSQLKVFTLKLQSHVEKKECRVDCNYCRKALLVERWVLHSTHPAGYDPIAPVKKDVVSCRNVLGVMMGQECCIQIIRQPKSSVNL